MRMTTKGKAVFLFALIFIFAFSCATTQEMSPAQKYGTYRTAFNDVIQHQYIPWAHNQPETTKVILRADVNPRIKKVYEALDVYKAELAAPGGDPEAKMNLYLGLKNELFALILKYGLKIDESQVKGGAHYGSSYNLALISDY